MKQWTSLLVAVALVPSLAFTQPVKKQDPKMDKFISELMKKMTVDEKIGQLNLVTAGEVTTGSTVSTGVEAKIASGQIGDIVGSITRPVKELKGFQKINLKAGESKIVTFTISEEDLKFYNHDLKFVAEPGDFTVFIGTNSQDLLQTNFELK